MLFSPFDIYYSVLCYEPVSYLELQQLIARYSVDHFSFHLYQVEDLPLLFLFMSFFCNFSNFFYRFLGPLGLVYFTLGSTQPSTLKNALQSTQKKVYLLCSALSPDLDCTRRVTQICFTCLTQNFSSFLHEMDPN